MTQAISPRLDAFIHRLRHTAAEQRVYAAGGAAAAVASPLELASARVDALPARERPVARALINQLRAGLLPSQRPRGYCDGVELEAVRRAKGES